LTAERDRGPAPPVEGGGIGHDPSDTQGLRARTLANVGVTAAWNLAARGAANFAGKVAIARLFLRTEVGAFELAQRLIGIFGRVGDLGIGAAIVQRRTDVERAYETGFVLRAVVLVAGALLVAAIAPLWARFYETPELRDMVWVLAAPYLFGALAFVPGIRLYRDLRHGQLSFANFLNQLVLLVVAIGGGFAGWGAWSFVAGTIAGLAANWIALVLLSPWRPRLRYDGRLARELVAFGKFVLGAQLLAYGIPLVDTLTIGKLLGTEEVATYVYAYGMGGMIATEVAELVSRALQPAMARRQGDPAALARGFRGALRPMAVLAFPFGFGLAAVAPEFALGFFGEEWASVAAPMRILAAFGILLSLERVGEPVLHALGVPAVVMRGRLAQLLVLAVGIVPAVHFAGLEGAAAVATASAAVAAAIVLGRVCSGLRLSPWTLARDLLPPFLVAAGMAAGVLLARDFLVAPGTGPLPGLLAEVALGVALYLVLGWLAMPRLARECLDLVRHFLRR
jgi:O-antigen/teichoic acid export membrane protein